MKFYLALILALTVIVVGALSYIDVVMQEAYDHRWAVSHIASLVPDEDNSWRLRLAGYQFTLEPERAKEDVYNWLAEQAGSISAWRDALLRKISD